MAGSFALVGKGFIGREFVNKGDRGEVVVNVELPKDATIAQTNLKTQEVEQYILSKAEVVNEFSSIGKSDNQFTAQGSKDKTEISVKLVDKSMRRMSMEKFAQQIKKELQEKVVGAKRIGGLTSSMLLTLVLVPVIYLIIDRLLAARKSEVSLPIPAV